MGDILADAEKLLDEHGEELPLDEEQENKGVRRVESVTLSPEGGKKTLLIGAETYRGPERVIVAVYYGRGPSPSEHDYDRGMVFDKPNGRAEILCPIENVDPGQLQDRITTAMAEWTPIEGHLTVFDK